MPKVKEFYKQINLEDLAVNQGMNEFREREYKFVKDVWELEIESLSQKQIEWLIRISEKYELKS